MDFHITSDFTILEPPDYDYVSLPLLLRILILEKQNLKSKGVANYLEFVRFCGMIHLVDAKCFYFSYLSLLLRSDTSKYIGLDDY